MSAPVMDMWEIGFMEPLVGTLVRKELVDFENVEQEFPLGGFGMFTAFEEQTEKTTRGLRTWRTAKLYCDSQTVFFSDDIIVVAEGRFRVSKPKDWSRRGYNAYNLTEDYDG